MLNTNKPNSSLAAALLILIVLGAAAFFIFKQDDKKNNEKTEKPQSTAFEGPLVKIENNSMYMKGYYVIDENLIKTFKPIETEVVAKINADTKFRRIELVRPTEEELQKNNRQFRLENLQKNESIVNFDKFQEDYKLFGANIRVNAKEDIYGKTEITADSVEYSFLTLPPLPPQ